MTEVTARDSSAGQVQPPLLGGAAGLSRGGSLLLFASSCLLMPAAWQCPSTLGWLKNHTPVDSSCSEYLQSLPDASFLLMLTSSRCALVLAPCRLHCSLLLAPPHLVSEGIWVVTPQMDGMVCACFCPSRAVSARINKGKIPLVPDSGKSICNSHSSLCCRH